MATRSPGRTPSATSPPARRATRSWNSPQLCVRSPKVVARPLRFCCTMRLTPCVMLMMSTSPKHRHLPRLLFELVLAISGNLLVLVGDGHELLAADDVLDGAKGLVAGALEDLAEDPVGR